MTTIWQCTITSPSRKDRKIYPDSHWKVIVSLYSDGIMDAILEYPNAIKVTVHDFAKGILFITLTSAEHAKDHSAVKCMKDIILNALEADRD